MTAVFVNISSPLYHANLLGMHTRIFCLAPAMVASMYVRTISRPYQSTHACMHTHTRGTPRTHACMCTHTRVTFPPESKSDLGSCETIRKCVATAINRVSHAPSLRYAPSARVQMTERTYVRTYIPRIDPDLYCLALMCSAITVYLMP